MELYPLAFDFTGFCLLTQRPILNQEKLETNVGEKMKNESPDEEEVFGRG